MITLLFAVMVKDPDLNKIQSNQMDDSTLVKSTSYLLDDNVKESKFQEIKRLTSHVYKTCMSNIVFPVVLLGSMIGRSLGLLFSTFLALWITSFVDSGYFTNENEAESVIQHTNVVSVIISVGIMMPLGRAADKYPFKFMIPQVFLLLSLATFIFWFIETPDSWPVYVATTFVVICGLSANTFLESLFTKNIPKDIRGTMNGLQSCAGTIGGIIFSKIAGEMYDVSGPKAPFIVASSISLVYAVFVLFLGISGKFNH